jgi:hypothetical protein
MIAKSQPQIQCVEPTLNDVEHWNKKMTKVQHQLNVWHQSKKD